MKKETKSENELLQEKLFIDRKSTWLSYSDKEKKSVMDYAEEYKAFLAASKTERLCVENIITALEKAGYRDISTLKSAAKGTRLYKSIKGKALIAAIVGADASQWRLVGSHIDSPRLDLKPSPLFEDSDLALLKTHYYGGIKKYHWVNLPLALHGVVFTKDGKKVTVELGEKDGEPKYIIPDLLPHLASDQMQRKPSKIVEGEELNVIFAGIPVNDDKVKEKVKFAVLKKLNEKYGMTEEDFATAEFEFVPAGKPCDIGIDSSMIAAYGQDDRVCAFATLKALLAAKPKHTAIALFTDKEEIGSFGDTGAESFMISNFMENYLALTGLKTGAARVFEASKAISADVTCAQDPNFKSVNESNNVSFLGRGVAVEKYGGGGGKYNSQDASAEYMAYIRALLDKNKVAWQTGELGRIDLGGGGTIAMLISRFGMDCVDMGPALLGMHAPFELSSKSDVYNAFKAYRAFFED